MTGTPEVATTWSIARRIVAHAEGEGADRPALTVDGETWTYARFVAAASSLAAALRAGAAGEESPATAFMAQRNVSSYVAVLACLMAGHAWVPVNVEHPDARNLAVLRKSKARLMVCGGRAEAAFEAMFAKAPVTQPALDLVKCSDSRAGWPERFAAPEMPFEIAADSRAYVLFTSGSTGEPKGVPITHGALTGYIDAALALMPTGPEDRFSQTFELTFDLSIHDMMLAWCSGAHLIVATKAELTRPAEYIRDHAITRWFSVPSLAFQMRMQGDLTPNAFPTLKTSLFCGEALPWTLADEWALAAPNGSVENWYGPTEATIACSRFVMPPQQGEPPHDLAPIGEAFDGMRLSIHREDLSPAPDGEPGELYLSGRQLSEGYLDDPERNAKTFVKLPGEDVVSYKTGDRVVRDPGGTVRFLGRVDNQVKVRGFRIELGEIEAALRKAAGGVNAIAMSWPPEEPSGRFVVAALETAHVDAAAVVARVADMLPDYMTPAQLVAMPTFPVNASGKADRKQIAERTRALLADAADAGKSATLSGPSERLMDAIRLVSPTLSRKRVLEADTVMAAGMDSLSFIGLTAEIERIYSRTLSQEEVVELSLLPFNRLVALLEERARPPGFLDRMFGPLERWLERRKATGPEGLTHRTNRALQFITKFPRVLAALEQPLVLALGSSGTFRGIDPEAFEEEARTHGKTVACLNVGLPAISNRGLARLAIYIRETCAAVGERPAVVLYELDPMQISVLPPSRETPLSESFFTGKVKPFPDGQLKPEFEWSAEARGVWLHERGAGKDKRRPNWEKARDTEVARTFAGDVDFVLSEIETWEYGLRTLQSAADRVVVFIHPPNTQMMDELDPEYGGGKLEAVLERLRSIPGVELVTGAFDLADADFLDINHVNPGQGRPKLSRQLARWLFA